MISVEAAEYIDGYRLKISFSDGRIGTVDLDRTVREDQRSVFAELKNLKNFRAFKVDLDTICWSNGLDLAPEYLYFLAFRDDPDLQAQFIEWGYSSTEALTGV